MSKYYLKPREVEAIRWTDNLPEMKHFCGKNCTITYESTPLDDFFQLVIDDFVKEKEVSVPFGNYVVCFGKDMFTTMSESDLMKYFTVTECVEIPSEIDEPVDAVRFKADIDIEQLLDESNKASEQAFIPCKKPCNRRFPCDSHCKIFVPKDTIQPICEDE